MSLSSWQPFPLCALQSLISTKVKVDGKIVGAVGVSGGSAQEDMEIAKACVKAFETI